MAEGGSVMRDVGMGWSGWERGQVTHSDSDDTILKDSTGMIVQKWEGSVP